MGVASKFPDRGSPLEDLLHQVGFLLCRTLDMNEINYFLQLAYASEGEPTPQILRQYEEICERLIDNIVDATGNVS